MNAEILFIYMTSTCGLKPLFTKFKPGFKKGAGRKGTILGTDPPSRGLYNTRNPCCSIGLFLPTGTDPVPGPVRLIVQGPAAGPVE